MTEDEVRRIVREEIERRTPPQQIHPQPPGCICPAGAERTCQSTACPRRRLGGFTWMPSWVLGSNA